MNGSMSTAELLSLLSTVFFIIAAVCLTAAIVLFIVFRIPSVISDLSGRKTKKTIEQMRSINENSGKKSFKSSETNAERGKITGLMDEKTKQKKNDKAGRTDFSDGSDETAFLGETGDGADGSDETAFLGEMGDGADGSDETVFLGEMGDGADGSGETEFLGQSDEDESEGTVFLGEEPVHELPPHENSSRFTITEEVMLIHTDEVI